MPNDNLTLRDFLPVLFIAVPLALGLIAAWLIL
jgi:hypothetical protein